MLTAEQLRGARAALRLEQQTLADLAGISVETVKRLEKMDGDLSAKGTTLIALRRALEEAGLDFIDEATEGGPGFRISLDRHKRLRQEVCSALSSVVDGLLMMELRKDPHFYDKGVEHVAATVEKELPFILRHTLKRLLPRTRK